jgi:hypothetical protein
MGIELGIEKGLAGTFVPLAVRGTLQDNKGGYGR